MKTILAHWKKDLVSSRGMFIGWALCVALVFLFFTVRVFPHPAWLSLQPGAEGLPRFIAVFFALATGLVGLMGIQLVLLVLLVIQVIHLDPLTVPDAFWRTRPISGGALLAAKSLFVVLLLLGTCLSVAAIEIHYPAMLTVFLAGIVFITGVAAFAAITTNVSQMILHWLGTVVLASLSAHALLAAWQLSLDSIHGSSFSVNFNRHISTISATDSLWLAILYLFGFLAAILCQYLSLRTDYSRAILFATFLFTALLQYGS